MDQATRVKIEKQKITVALHALDSIGYDHPRLSEYKHNRLVNNILDLSPMRADNIVSALYATETATSNAEEQRYLQKWFMLFAAQKAPYQLEEALKKFSREKQVSFLAYKNVLNTIALANARLPRLMLDGFTEAEQKKIVSTPLLETIAWEDPVELMLLLKKTPPNVADEYMSALAALIVTRKEAPLLVPTLNFLSPTTRSKVTSTRVIEFMINRAPREIPALKRCLKHNSEKVNQIETLVKKNAEAKANAYAIKQEQERGSFFSMLDQRDH